MAAVATGDLREIIGDLDTLDIFGVLVAELALDPQAQGCAMGDVERPAVQIVRDQRLRMERIDEPDALVILSRALFAALGRLALEIIGAMKDGVARADLKTRRPQQRRQRHARPLADRAPAFHAIVARDL